jgi:hypothetical protein
MKKFKVAAMIFCLCLVVVSTLSSAKADEWNRKTTITFSGPVEVPGVGAQTLPAGSYIFKVMDLTDRHIVQIFNMAEDHVYTTILAIPNFRMKATNKTVVTFKERGEGQPEAIRAWFYPGRQWGEQFVYPKTRALELAKISNEPVLAIPVETAAIEELKTVEIVAVKPTGDEVAVSEVVETPPAATEAPVQVAVAPVATPEPVAVTPEPVAAAETLPATASPLSLIALIGMLSIGAFFGLSVIGKRTF